MARPRKLLPNRRSMGKRARLFTKNRRTGAAMKIARAYRSYRGRRPFLRTRFLAGAGNLTIKHRLNKQITLKDMVDFPTLSGGTVNDCKAAFIYFAPWRNVSTTFDAAGQSNLFYNESIAKYFTEPTPYGCFRLKGVYMDIRRPKNLIESQESSPTVKDNSFYDRPSTLWGTEILHTQQVLQADTQTGVVQPGISAIKQGRVVKHPVSWDEAVDDGGGRFKITMGGFQKRVWKPSTLIEKRWRQVENSELDHSTGGIMLLAKGLADYPIPNYDEYSLLAQQVIYEIIATIYMEFKVKV